VAVAVLGQMVLVVELEVLVAVALEQQEQP
jgi:hypothetical protein